MTNTPEHTDTVAVIPPHVRAIIDDLVPACLEPWKPGIEEMRRNVMERFWHRLASTPKAERDGVRFEAAVGRAGKVAIINGVPELLRLINGGAKIESIRDMDAPVLDESWDEVGQSTPSDAVLDREAVEIHHSPHSTLIDDPDDGFMPVEVLIGGLIYIWQGGDQLTMTPEHAAMVAAALRATPSPSISDATRRMEKTLGAKFERRAETPSPSGEVERLREELAEFRQRDVEQRARIIKLVGAVEAQSPIALDAGSWFYPEGDTSSDECRFSVDEVVDYAVEGMAEGEARVVVVERAVHLPDVYAAVRVFTDAEKDARGSDDDTDFTLHATLEEARTALDTGNLSDEGVR